MTKIVGQQGTKSAWVLRATLHLSVPIGHWAHATRRLENLQGRSSAPRPAPSPLSKGRWTWGLLVAFGLPSQGLPSGGQVPGSLRFPGSLEGRPSFPGPLWPLLPPCGLPGQEASVHQGPALLSLAPLRPVSAAPLLGSWAPSLSSHLSVSHPPRPLTPPARPGVPAACPLPACLPVACPSCPHAGFWKEPTSPPGLAPVPGALPAPGGAGSPGSLHLKDTGPAWAPALAALAPPLQARSEAHRVCWPEGSPP